jgi:hypothetical protein
LEIFVPGNAFFAAIMGVITAKKGKKREQGVGLKNKIISSQLIIFF